MSQSEFVLSLRSAVIRCAAAGIALAGTAILALYATGVGTPTDEITMASYGVAGSPDSMLAVTAVTASIESGEPATP